MRKVIIIVFAMLFMLVSCADATVKQYKLNVIAEYPHDTESYTQGLFFHKGEMYETTGLNGKSTLRKVDMESGKPLKRLDFDKKYFVEGSVVLDGNLYILTWESRIAFIYDSETLTYKSSKSYPREGWGITTDGKQLIASDGSSNLYFMDKDMKLLKKVPVTLNDKPVLWLNELEYIDGKIWANVYTMDEIVIINPKNGKVEAVVDCRGLLPQKMKKPSTDVLNGIAFNTADGKIYLTGKNWPRLYEVSLTEKN